MGREHTKPEYETGMKIVYDAATRRVVVSFRARVSVLPGTHDTESEAVKAGEAYCRQHGWKPDEMKSKHGALRHAWDSSKED